jgi:hypothetical protein
LKHCVQACQRNGKILAGESDNSMWYNLKMLKQLASVLVFAVVILGSTHSIAIAHGTGVSYEESKDGYKIDIGHDEFIAARESTRFDFALFPEDISAVEGEVFTDVWVTFTKEKKLYFAGGVHKPVFGSTGFTYVFPEEGSYIISARFQKEGQTVVETEFPLEAETEQLPIIANGIFAAGGLLLGVAMGLFIPRKKTLLS